ncbi:glycoside hydrolase superfamily [Spinellus fusiger]|nr:glycoside hydrolase superfamily [Spinellus fusiger]
MDNKKSSRVWDQCFAVVAATVNAQYFYGLDYGIDQTKCPSLEEITNDFRALKPYTQRLRIFSLSVCNQGALALQASQAVGLHLYLGLWIDRPETFDSELKALADITSQYSLENVEAAIVGSEVLYRGDTDADSLAAYIQKVKAILGPKGVQVTNADVYYKLPPNVIQQVDFVMMNAFPYWEGVTVEQGAATLMSHYDYVKTISQGKPVRISETGWPAGGGNFGASIASPENQALYLSKVLCITKQRNIDLFWFSAKDEPYHTGVEATWGLLYPNTTLKSAISLSTLQNPC